MTQCEQRRARSWRSLDSDIRHAGLEAEVIHGDLDLPGDQRLLLGVCPT